MRPLVSECKAWLRPFSGNALEGHVEQVVARMVSGNARRMDRCFSILMVPQWIVAVAMAVWITPRTWIGAVSAPSPFIAIALVVGGVISLTPAAMAWLLPGERLTRHMIAAGQMLMSALLIHLSGGRTEMHFHIFGSLAFLACYMDWTVLVTASTVILLDHTAGNFFWPHATFGPADIQNWRWLEHAGWVLFCDTFLIASCVGRMRNLRVLAVQSVEQAGLLEQAYTDALTGLPNRLRFQKEVESAIVHAKTHKTRFALMYVDLDRFKEVNDTFGHAMGDRVLVEIAGRLSVGQDKYSMFARIGGDEFVAVCTSGSADYDIDGRAREILTSLLLPIDVDGQRVSIGASIGVSLYPDDGRDQEQLLAHADAAMYDVKRKRRRGYTFYGGAMNATTEERAHAEICLREAIEGDEFEMYYQPLLGSNGRLEGLEALVRWHRPGQGMASPAEFITLAEDTGLILPLGHLILKKVCRQVARWTASGLDFGQVGVNLSPKQLTEGFLQTLDETMAGSAVRPGMLCFEITETAYVADDLTMTAILEGLRDRGIAVSLDDFGTGYSSLGRLQALTFTTLKIDQIFISRLGQSETGYRVVEAIINLAHVLSMTVVAEGVENEGQVEILRDLGCDQLQGYYYARPLSAEAAAEFILANCAASACAMPRKPGAIAMPVEWGSGYGELEGLHRPARSLQSSSATAGL